MTTQKQIAGVSRIGATLPATIEKRAGTCPPPKKIANGVAAPAIEAWWFCKSNPQISEAAWENGLAEKREPYSRLELKKQLYDSDYHSLELITRKMTEAAQVIAGDLPALERAFPEGFGTLAKELRSWRRIS